MAKMQNTTLRLWGIRKHMVARLNKVTGQKFKEVA